MCLHSKSRKLTQKSSSSRKMAIFKYVEFALVLFGVTLNLVSAIEKSEIPYANVTLSGGPSGLVEEGENFALNCEFSGQYDSRIWTPIAITFYLNDVKLGKFQKKSEKRKSDDNIYWVTKELSSGVNVFSNSAISDTFNINYSVWIQPLLKSVAQGVYKCSVTLEDFHSHARARYFSNLLSFN